MSSAGIAAALPPTKSSTDAAQSQASDYYSKGSALGSEVKTGIAGAMKDFEGREEKADELEKSLDPNALTPPNLKPPPVAEETSAIKEWGSAAMAVAALGGLFTRQPLTNSLNAAAGVLNAYKARDAEAAKTAYDTWKVANDNAIEAAKWTVEAYKSALEQIKIDRDAGKGDLLAVAAALKDDTIPYMLQHYGLDATTRLIGDTDRMVASMERAQAGIEKANTQAQLALALHAATDDLHKAIATKDPAQIAAAREEVVRAHQDITDFDSVYAPPRSSAAAGETGDVKMSKDVFDKAVSSYNSVKSNPASSPEDVKAAKKDRDDAEKAYRAAVAAEGNPDAGASIDLIHPKGGKAAKADPSWPPATGHPDGSKLKDAAGDVVATAKNGLWIPVKGIP